MLGDVVEWLIPNLQEGDTAHSAQPLTRVLLARKGLAGKKCLLQHDMRAAKCMPQLVARISHGRRAGGSAVERFVLKTD